MIAFFPLLLFLFSCASTIEVERLAQNSSGAGRQIDPASVIRAVPIEVDPPPPVIIERPIYIPQGASDTAAMLPQPPMGRAAVQAAINDGIVQPQDYSHAAIIYTYDRDLVYELYARPFRMSNIALEPGEQVIDIPFISDSERWMVGAGVSYENGVAVQHIYVKPTQSDLIASLIINTDRRVYHLILRSFNNVHMPIVRWRYLDHSIPQRFIRDIAAAGGVSSVATNALNLNAADNDSSLFADPRFLSFNYRITWGFFQKPRWLPTLVYDDGRRTYIRFPDVVLQTEMPAVFEDRADVLNYRVHENVMIIDKLVEKISVKLGNRVVTIEKRRG